MESDPDNQEGLSKNAQKKLAKKKEWEARKDIIKQNQKEKKKLAKQKNKGRSDGSSYAHLTRFNFYDKETGKFDKPIEGDDLPPKLSKQEK